MKQTFIHRKLDRVLDALCEIEDVTRFDYRKVADQFNILQFEIVIERQQQDVLVLQFPVLEIATQPSQQILVQILKICGWRKDLTQSEVASHEN